MKKFKLASIVLSAVLTASSMFSAVSGEESKKKYTFDELNNMSSEDFLKLENAQSYYNSLKKIAEKEGGLRLAFSDSTRSDDLYNYYYTEKSIIELLGDSVAFDLCSPVTSSENGSYGADFLNQLLRISNTDYTYTLENLTENEYLFFAKFQYCLNQVCNMNYEMSSNRYLPNPNVQLIGDINGDNEITVRDAACLANILADKSGSKLTELDKNVADVNCDGKINVRDCTKIARYVIALNLASQDPAFYK